jgi:putative transposase
MRWYCYYHFVWATKHREALILPKIEPVIFDSIRQKTKELHPNNNVIAINAMPDHLHIALQLYPAVSISDWVKRTKGASSHVVNTSFQHFENRFRWQKGYSVHTFGAKMIPFIVSYINNQKEHHANNSVEAYIEELDDD